MKETITAKEFRKQEIDKIDRDRKVINKHFNELWEIAKDFQTFRETYRINTAYGSFIFSPDFTFSYSIKK